MSNQAMPQQLPAAPGRHRRAGGTCHNRRGRAQRLQSTHGCAKTASPHLFLLGICLSVGWLDQLLLRPCCCRVGPRVAFPLRLPPPVGLLSPPAAAVPAATFVSAPVGPLALTVPVVPPAIVAPAIILTRRVAVVPALALPVTVVWSAVAIVPPGEEEEQRPGVVAVFQYITG